MIRDEAKAHHWGWLQWCAFLCAGGDAHVYASDKLHWEAAVCRALDAGEAVAVAAFDDLYCAGSYRRGGRLIRNGDWVWFEGKK